MQYITWRELRDQLQNATDEQLAEPVLFALTDRYGYEVIYPATVIRDTWHPADPAHWLCYDEAAEEMVRRILDPVEELVHFGERDLIRLRQLPRQALLLDFSDMEEDLDERNKQLAKPNPHAPAPAPLLPGPAPLFD